MALASLLAASAIAQDAALKGLSWTEQKCVLYRQAFGDAVRFLGQDGIGDSFLAGNTAFIESGCTDEVKICPRSEKELQLANLLTLMTMNEGMASTFAPLGCAD